MKIKLLIIWKKWEIWDGLLWGEQNVTIPFQCVRLPFSSRTADKITMNFSSEVSCDTELTVRRSNGDLCLRISPFHNEFRHWFAFTETFKWWPVAQGHQSTKSDIETTVLSLITHLPVANLHNVCQSVSHLSTTHLLRQIGNGTTNIQKCLNLSLIPNVFELRHVLRSAVTTELVKNNCK
jgi:hypothetical protein